MSRSFPSLAKAIEEENFSMGYAVDSITPRQVILEKLITLAPGGAIYSSANDMGKWLRTWLNEGQADDRQVIPKAYISEAIANRVDWPYSPNDSTNVNYYYYGYGWMNWLDQGHRRSEHSGGLSGYSSNVVFFPDDKIGLVVLTNQTTTTLASAVSEEIISRMLPAYQKRPQQIQYRQVQNILPADTPTVLNEERPPTFDLSELPGTYLHPGYGEVIITFEGETLYADFPMTKMRLTHNEDNEFFDYYTEEVPLIMDNFMRLVFRANDQGQVNALEINLDPVPVGFQKVD